MTLEQVIGIVGDHTGQKVTAETKLSDLGMDSLDFLELMVILNVPDEIVPDLNTVLDIYMMRTPILKNDVQ